MVESAKRAICCGHADTYPWVMLYGLVSDAALNLVAEAQRQVPPNAKASLAKMTTACAVCQSKGTSKSCWQSAIGVDEAS